MAVEAIDRDDVLPLFGKRRVGRTGRGRNKGQALSFCSEREKEVLEEIESFLDKPIAVLEVGKGEYLETLSLTNEKPNDWKAVMQEMEEEDAAWKAMKKKRRKKR